MNTKKQILIEELKKLESDANGIQEGINSIQTQIQNLSKQLDKNIGAFVYNEMLTKRIKEQINEIEEKPVTS